MRYLLFASHGRLAEGMLDSVEMITGKRDNIFTISAYKNENEDLTKQLESVLMQINEEDELIIVTDIFGGSVNNECLKLLHDTRIHLIAGLNLALVIELVTQVNFQMDTDELINKALKNAKDTIIYCNKVIRSEPEDEDF
ncbi:hypothetical protein F3157_13135 [Virgibacillus dakarensis]|uniref:PTS mannose transporter subunit IIA n=1 Tax=Lentibacillus populi TaxID=1827502 RepID=A0A9W5X5X1_9BACI|nr:MULTISPECIES: PTS sugar transporter subunit IIA [Bacillaceae]MBT2216404.1 PTS sugar transporter subunit IIA [Virgibacillus dakarensis]MTW86594.1 hypothetical protein [Virgibacillus dakarensis]GGB47231.1 PTS mannose transporter subunit IIA [Lentibacillus populi]